MTFHVLVDETKQRDYIMVSCALPSADLQSTRAQFRGHFLPGLRELHMSRERDTRRKLIAATVARSPVRATVYVAGRHHDDHTAREACLRAIVEDAHQLGARRLLLDRDESVERADNRVLFARTLELGCRDILRYEHCNGRDEVLMVLPDAVAWCWAKGGTWRRRVEPVIKRIRRV